MIERTFHIRTSFNSGSAFAIEYNNQQYLVTAKHVVDVDFDRLVGGETIRLYNDEGQMLLAQVQRVTANPGKPDMGEIDVAVLELADRIDFNSQALPVGRPEDMFVTQQVVMPSAELWVGFNGAFGMVTRTGTIAKIYQPQHRGIHTGDLLVAMEAYQGFSGSPIIYWNQKREAKIIAIAARLSWQTVPAFGTSPIHTGFIGCFYIQHALNLVQ